MPGLNWSGFFFPGNSIYLGTLRINVMRLNPRYRLQNQLQSDLEIAILETLKRYQDDVFTVEIAMAVSNISNKWIGHAASDVNSAWIESEIERLGGSVPQPEEIEDEDEGGTYTYHPDIQDYYQAYYDAGGKQVDKPTEL